MKLYLIQTGRNSFLNEDDRSDYWEVSLCAASHWRSKKDAEDALMDALHDDINLNPKRCKVVRYKLEPNEKGG